LSVLDSFLVLEVQVVVVLFAKLRRSDSLKPDCNRDSLLLLSLSNLNIPLVVLMSNQRRVVRNAKNIGNLIGNLYLLGTVRDMRSVFNLKALSLLFRQFLVIGDFRDDFLTSAPKLSSNSAKVVLYPRPYREE
jgi:hypothetical protein